VSLSTNEEITATSLGKDRSSSMRNRYGAAPRWLTLALDESGVAASLAHRTGRGFLRKRVCAHGISWGLNWYRNMDRNWELLAPVSGVQVTVPALYIAGNRDLVLAFRGMDQIIANLSKFVPQLRRTILFSGCGQRTQQERVQEVNQAVIECPAPVGQHHSKRLTRPRRQHAKANRQR
jgi:pimeloyl-ACP methyl ester carboxylesterase